MTAHVSEHAATEPEVGAAPERHAEARTAQEAQVPPQSRATQFRAGLWRGLVLSVVLGAAFLYAGTMSGWLVVSVGNMPNLVDAWHWTYDNLRSSAVLFAAVLIWFGATLRLLSATLTREAPEYDRVYRLDRRSDVLVGLFFGIGVIWTAIGMRSALVGALGDLDAESAAHLGAFGVLQALVDEGILLALSTTIVGGIGGYLMRIGKLLFVGARLDSFYTGLGTRANEQVLTRLEAIEAAVTRLASDQVTEREAERPLT